MNAVVPDPPPLGFTGRMAAFFIDSRLTVLLIVVSLLLGIGATIVLPREEEPQIIVPMADVQVQMPGATASEVEQRVTTPMEKLVKEIPGVEYVYSTTRPGSSMLIVRFLVGQNPEAALVRLYNKLYSNQDIVPPGVVWPPLIKERSIDDVPILAITLHSKTRDGYLLRQIGDQLEEQLKQVPDVSETDVIGGQSRQVRLDLQPERLAAYGLSPSDLMRALGSQNTQSDPIATMQNNRSVLVRVGNVMARPEELGGVVVGVKGDHAIYLRDVAQIHDGGAEPDRYVFFGTEQAVTISFAKRTGANAITVADGVLQKLRTIAPHYLPDDVKWDITRNYGETAAARGNELLKHMGLSVLSVVLLMALVLGRRESMVVAIAIPVTLALTVCTFVLYHFTLNRVTFFALIFSIGILVDDAIVVVENVVRHLRLPESAGRPLTQVVLEAVDEVGNPTILATLTVMAAILPMAFVRGLMGPYMLPIPLGASAAMFFSLLVAFSIIPYAAKRILAGHGGSHAVEREDLLTRFYRKMMGRLITRPRWRAGFLIGIVVLLLASLSLMGLRFVIFKMLPFDNKSEFQILVNMPDGSTLEQTAAATRDLGLVVAGIPEVTNYETYVGTASPYNFNGLVRHYFLRSGPNQADIQVNLLPKEERHRSSHEIARATRECLSCVAARYGATLQVTEIPPGPPVLQTLVTEVYGPSRPQQIQLAAQIKQLYEHTPDVVDVDWYMERPQPQVDLDVDREKAARVGITPQEVQDALTTALVGTPAGLLHDPNAREPIPLLLRFSLEHRTMADLQSVQLPGPHGLVPLSTLLEPRTTLAETSIYHKNLQPVVYVIGDVAGKIDSPLYAIAAMQPHLTVPAYFIQQPPNTEQLSVKWDGEWQVTYEVFRDLGIAFAVVLVLIYALIVGWFENFLTPLVIVSAIPFSLVGIMPAHWLLGAYFSATSMIGFIAGAGIVVRNSIILVDFIELRLRQGMPLEEAVIDAGAVRFRPMMLTAAAVVAGSLIMLADPIFQGLAISLMAGEVASLLLSRTAVPVLYYMLWRKAGATT
ncbi:MAG: efflux RND transporter permease subunit [Candidatus Xenobia bacterium]